MRWVETSGYLYFREYGIGFLPVWRMVDKLPQRVRIDHHWLNVYPILTDGVIILVLAQFQYPAAGEVQMLGFLLVRVHAFQSYLLVAFIVMVDCARHQPQEFSYFNLLFAGG